MSFRDWQVGDRVVCVETWLLKDGTGDEAGPVAGHIYTIREIGLLHPFKNDVCVRLAEIINPIRAYLDATGEACFAAARFRKVEPRKTSIAIFERFLLNPNAPVREDA